MIKKYGDIEQVIAHAGDLTPKLREAITKYAEQVRVNKELGHLLDDVQIDLDPAQLRLEAWDDETVRNLFLSLEFRSLHERLKEIKFHSATAAPALEVNSIAEFTSESEVRDSEAVAFAWNEDWLAVCDSAAEARVLPFADAVHRLAGCLKDPHRPKIAHDAKALFRA